MGVLVTGLYAGIQATEDLKDPVTADLLTGIARELELDLWFLESHLEPGDEALPVSASVKPSPAVQAAAQALAK